MQVDVRFRGIVPTGTLRAHVERRARAHLARFGQEVSFVLLRIDDVNGPKGGTDKQCQIVVLGPRIGSAALADVGDDAYTCVDGAAGRMREAVARRLQRARRLRREPATPWRSS